MFNACLSVFLLLAFALTWSGIGAVLNRFAMFQKYLQSHLDTQKDVLEKQVSTNNALLHVLKEFDEHLANNTRAVDTVHGIVIDIKENTKHKQKKSKGE